MNLLTKIRENPQLYLPETSLQALEHFRNGYASRSAMEGRPHDWGFERREFWKWLNSHFGLQDAQALSDITIVASFSENDVDAFARYFDLLDEFIHHKPRTSSSLNVDNGVQQKDFVRVVKSIRQRPALHLGWA